MCITSIKEGPIFLLIFGIVVLFVGSTVFTYGLKAMIKTNSQNIKELK
jgi:CHASE3 domain sensor protein